MNKKIILNAAAALLITISAMANATWTIKNLGTLGASNPYAFASAINDSGVAVGASSIPSAFPFIATNHAFISYPGSTGLADLGTLSGIGGSAARGINSSGQVVGESSAADRTKHAFITGTNGIGMTSLPYPDDALMMSAQSINDSGQVTGWVLNFRGYTYPCPGCEGTEYYESYGYITGANGIGMTKLDTLGGPETYSYDINNSGQVTGVSSIAGGASRHAYITGPNGAGITDLGTLGGTDSEAWGINDFGRVTGSSFTASNAVHAFITGPNGAGMIDLGTLGGNYSAARGINNHGQVVGVSTTAEGIGHAFLTGVNGIGMTDLSLLAPVVAAGWTQLNPLSINNKGQIVGYGTLRGHSQAFLLNTPDISPVPESSTYAMLLVGLGLLFFRTKTELNS